MVPGASGPGNVRSRVGPAGRRGEAGGSGTTDAAPGTRGGPVGASVRCGGLFGPRGWPPFFGVVFRPALSPDLRVDGLFAGACARRVASARAVRSGRPATGFPASTSPAGGRAGLATGARSAAPRWNGSFPRTRLLPIAGQLLTEAAASRTPKRGRNPSVVRARVPSATQE